MDLFDICTNECLYKVMMNNEISKGYSENRKKKLRLKYLCTDKFHDLDLSSSFITHKEAIVS